MMLGLFVFCSAWNFAAGCPACNRGSESGIFKRGWPQRSDVVLTSRALHLERPAGVPGRSVGPGTQQYTTWEAANAFRATRIDWVYTLNGSFVVAAHLPPHNLSAVSLAMNAQVPDPNGTYNIGRVLNVNGERLVAPWMRAWPQKPFYGCVNNPAYKNIAFDRARKLASLGADAIQHDDPTTNAEAVSWNDGDPKLSGCYCSVCMKGFTERLVDKGALNTTQRRKYNVTSVFNYRDYVKSAEYNRSSPKGKALRELFVDFQENATRSYLSELRQVVPPQIPMSGNNGGRWSRSYAAFDYGLGELSSQDANPGGLREIFVDGVPAGKKQIMTMPKASNITLDASPEFTRLTRRSIAQSYALGGNMMVPWDIYLPTPTADRYYGSAAQYADLFEFVRDQGRVLDATAQVPAYYRNSTEGFQLVHDGAGGDGARFRLPIDKVPSPGDVLPHQNLGSCAWNCRVSKGCAAFFSAAIFGPCYILRAPLHVINGTELPGESWLRMDTSVHSSAQKGAELVRGVATNDTFVDALLRARNISAKTWEGVNIGFALHLVNWRSGSTPAGVEAEYSILVSLENNAICGAIRMPGGASLPVMVAKLVRPGMAAGESKVLWNGPPSSGNITTLNVEQADVQPWAIIHLSCDSQE